MEVKGSRRGRRLIDFSLCYHMFFSTELVQVIIMKSVDHFVTLSAQSGLVPAGVVPAAYGGDVVVYFNDSKSARVEVEFLNSGEIVVGMDDGDQIQVLEWEDDRDRFNEYFLIINKYLAA